MNRFVQQSHDLIIFQDGDKKYADTLPNASADFKVEFPLLPPEIDLRIYEPGIRHALQAGDSVVGAGPMPWEMDDTLLTQIDAANDAKTARETAAAEAKRVAEEAAALKAAQEAAAAEVSATRTKEELFTYSSTVRRQREIRGTTLNGDPLPTDSRTQEVLSAAYTSAMFDETYSISNWKAAPGVYVSLSNATIKAMALAVRAHIQQCFDDNKTVDLKIDGGEVTTFSGVVAAYEALN